MCLSLPVKIVKKSGNKIFAQVGHEKIKVSDFLVKVKQGDYVYLRDTLIVGKTNEKDAKQIMNLIENKI
ncbi:HypC/HybG/HupF family hydrogenase formation chaperone [Patescibacteria group bacterium]|nr:HypC/HybG/HupF family hydrogenase formation chaperone [Patescibacteria group bacterium]